MNKEEPVEAGAALPVVAEGAARAPLQTSKDSVRTRAAGLGMAIVAAPRRQAPHREAAMASPRPRIRLPGLGVAATLEFILSRGAANR